jgi:tetratricopeptide (TPR) repeat protein
MKNARAALILFMAVTFMVSCSQEITDFNNALDADREAREKMRTATAKLEEYKSWGDEPEYAAEREAALTTATNAFNIAVEKWAQAKKLYEELMDLPGVNPDYLNNYANMLYYQYRMGFDNIDLKAGERALERAIEIDDRVIYKRNLHLLQVVDEDGKVAETRDKNARLLNLIQ